MESERRKKQLYKANKKWRDKNKEKIAAYSKKWLEKYKEEILSLKIGKSCSQCGYKEHQEILQFHHKNPMEKEIGIGKSHHNLERIKREINKCILLCPNCHMWEHFQKGMKYAAG